MLNAALLVLSKRAMPRFLLILLLLLIPAARAQFALAPETRIAVLGGVLAERMQHDGWLETLIQRRHPKHKLTLRHLGIAGDTFAKQLRPEGFGSLDDHLSFCKADVVIACFDLPPQPAEALRAQVAKFAEHLASQQYNGKTAPRLILVAPIAREPRHPLAAESANAALKPLVATLAEFATARGIRFVDLFAMSLAAYEKGGPYTTNGSFLNSAGNRLVATAIDRALFGEPPPEERDLEALRAAVLEKNRLWFSRYRVADGSRVYGPQSREIFSGLSNREVLLREQDIRAVMTENRDRAIWALLAGQAPKVDDKNTPEPIAVRAPEGAAEARFADAQSAMDLMTPADGFTVSLFASEEHFSELRNPAALAFDLQGRCWVATAPDGTQVPPKAKPRNAILVLSDANADGVADDLKVFADGLGVVTGLALLHDGVLVASPPDLLLLRDSDGDDVADSRERVLHGLGSADIDGAANSLHFAPDGWLYFLESAAQASQLTSPHGVLRNNVACAWRWRPRDGQAERYAPLRVAALRGLATDSWGRRIAFDPMAGFGYSLAPVSGRLTSGGHPAPPPLNAEATPRTQAAIIVASEQFPADMQGHLLLCGRGIQRYELGFEEAREMAPLIVSDDENFRPVDLAFSPDGTLFMAEWQSPVLGFQARHVRDPQRDSTHGRIYRLTAKDRPALKLANSATIPTLLEMLNSPTESQRQRARLALDGQPPQAVLDALGNWLSKLPEDAHQARVEALWAHQRRQVVNEPLLRGLLRAPSPEARVAAVRLLREWRLPDDLQLLRAAVADPDPRVRAEAVVTASFHESVDAATVALEVMKQPADPAVTQVLRQTIHQLGPIWQAAKTSGPLFADNPAGIAFLLGTIGSNELLALPRTEAVQRAMLVRVGVPREQRQAAIVSLAASTRQPAAKLLVEALGAADQASDDNTEAVIADLGDLLRKTLGAGVVPRIQLQRLLVGARRSQTRQLVFTLLIEIDGDPLGAWPAAVASLPALADFIHAASQVTTVSTRATLFDYLLPLISELPPNLEASEAERTAIQGAALAALATVPGHEAEKFAEFAALISLGQHVPEAVAAMSAIPTDQWPEDQLLDAVDGIAIFARGRGAAGREEADVVAALKLGEALAAALPQAEASRALEALRDLGGVTITISALRSKLVYDVKSFTVEAGQQVELVFHNGDSVPRNLAIAEPGAHEAIGTHLDTRQEDAPPRLLFSTKMLPSGASGRLAFTAPLEPGDYPFLCTMPDIWRSMSGVMKVVIP